jgi:hypothetical protein
MFWFKRKKVIPKDPLDTAKYQDPEWYLTIVDKGFNPPMSTADWKALLFGNAPEGKK